MSLQQVESLATSMRVSPMAVLSSGIRGAIAAEDGKELLIADFSQIESRVLAYVAGDKHKLHAFELYDRKEGPDAYIVTAAESFSRPQSSITKEERFLGKIMDLSLGFGGSVGAFMRMAGNYGREDFSEPYVKDLVETWRDGHTAIVDFWHAVDRAALDAVRNPGQVFKVSDRSNVYFRLDTNPRVLKMRLPSGRKMHYWYARETVGKFGNPAIKVEGVDSETRKWVQQTLWYGKFVENIVQAIAADILRGAMLRLRQAGFHIIMTVHDEIACEEKKGTKTIEELIRIMCESIDWLPGIPLAAVGDVSKRFHK